jgi:hypothetical protein
VGTGRVKLRIGFQHLHRAGADAQKTALAQIAVNFNFSLFCHDKQNYTSLIFLFLGFFGYIFLAFDPIYYYLGSGISNDKYFHYQ